MSTTSVFTCQGAWTPVLLDELRRTLPASVHQTVSPGWVASELAGADALATPCVAFAGQCLPQAVEMAAPSVSAWSNLAGASLRDALQDHAGPWRLHVFTVAAENGPKRGRCELIAGGIRELLKKKQRRLLRTLVEDPATPWADGEAVVQVALRTANRGWFSHCPPELRHRLRRVVSRFPGGEVLVPPDKAAPSRAFAKLAEAERRLGRTIAAGETCVDLGSSPGSWAWWALRRGARVVAVDRSPLRDDVMRHPALWFVQGDAFRYEPPAPVDWLLSDVIAFPERLIELLRQWLARRWCRWFCVTIKFRGADEYPRLEPLKAALAAGAAEFELRRLTSNKNEVTALGRCAAL